MHDLRTIIWRNSPEYLATRGLARANLKKEVEGNRPVDTRARIENSPFRPVQSEPFPRYQGNVNSERKPEPDPRAQDWPNTIEGRREARRQRRERKGYSE